MQSRRTATVVATLVLLSTPALGEASPLAGWSHFQEVRIENAGAAVADAQVAFTVDTADMVARGALRSDCHDLRVADLDLAPLPHWIESGCGTAATTVWARVPLVPEGSSRIVLAHGNPDAPDASDASSVFPLFDGFDGDALDGARWRIGGHPATLEVANGALHSYRPPGSLSFKIESTDVLAGPVVVEARMRLAPSPYYYSSLYYGDGSAYSSVGHVAYPQYESALFTGAQGVPPRTASYASTVGDVVANPPIGSWFTERFVVAPDALRRSVDGGAAEVSTRYAGVSSGRVGFIGAAPASTYAAETWIDWIRVYRLAEGVTATTGSAFTAPGAPLEVTAHGGPGVGEVTVEWSGPTENGGLPVERYRVYRDDVVVGETDGTTFVDAPPNLLEAAAYRVAAVNAVGEGPASQPACAAPFPVSLAFETLQPAQCGPLLG